jgi:hypothetical protein
MYWSLFAGMAVGMAIIFRTRIVHAAERTVRFCPLPTILHRQRNRMLIAWDGTLGHSILDTAKIGCDVTFHWDKEKEVLCVSISNAEEGDVAFQMGTTMSCMCRHCQSGFSETLRAVARQTLKMAEEISEAEKDGD